MAEQIISASSVDPQLPGNSFSIDLEYTTDPLDETLVGVGFRLHFDSSALTFKQLTNIFETNTNFVVGPNLFEDDSNFDGNDNTDKYVSYTWSNIDGNWPGEGETPTPLYTANFTTTDQFNEDTVLEFTPVDTAGGYTLKAPSITIQSTNSTEKQVISASSIEAQAADSSFSFDVEYSTEPLDETLGGLGLRLHFDSSAISFDELTNVFEGNSDVAIQDINDDADDFDNDSQTDKFVLFSWANFDGDWPGDGETPTLLYTANFTTSESFTEDTTLNFTASSTANEYVLDAPSITVEVNEAPSLADSSFSLAENSSSGTSVGTLTANDPEGDSLSYSLPNSSEFSIDSSGEITVADSSQLDFESNPNFAFDVEVSDGNLTDTASVTVNLDDVNEAPSLANASFSIDENSSNGAIVGRVSGSDPDGDALDYSINGTAFAIDSNGEITVADSSQLDFETTPNFALQVTASDGSLDAVANVSIDLNNKINENGFTYDVDQNGEIDGLTDGVLIIRHLFGIDGSELTDGAIATNAQRTNPEAIADYLDSGIGGFNLDNQGLQEASALDLDLNTELDALTDGIILARILFESSQSELVDGAISPNSPLINENNPNEQVMNFVESNDFLI